MTGTEFPSSVVLASQIFLDSSEIARLMNEEVCTDNLSYGSYSQKGRHVDLLTHFFLEQGLFSKVSSNIQSAGVIYLEYVRNMSPEHRAMTVFSRESKLPSIFQSVLKSHVWISHSLEFYEHYLLEHIKWDGGSDGHGELTRDFILDEEMLGEYYEQRLALYQALYKIWIR